MQPVFGYARVSATDQNLTTYDARGLHAHFQEKVSGSRIRRPALDKLLVAVRENDLVVNRLAWLGRNTVPTSSCPEVLPLWDGGKLVRG